MYSSRNKFESCGGGPQDIPYARAIHVQNDACFAGSCSNPVYSAFAHPWARDSTRTRPVVTTVIL